MAAFQDRYPGIEVSLLVANSQEVEGRVLAGELDLGFVGMGFQPGLQLLPYVRDRLLIVASPSHPLASGVDSPLERLRSERFLLREPGSGTRRVLEKALEHHSFQPGKVMELAGCEAVKRGAMAGMGIAAVSGYGVEMEVRQGLLGIITVEGLQLERQISVISRKDVRPSAAVLAFTALAHKLVPPDTAS